MLATVENETNGTITQLVPSKEFCNAVGIAFYSFSSNCDIPCHYLDIKYGVPRALLSSNDAKEVSYYKTSLVLTTPKDTLSLRRSVEQNVFSHSVGTFA